MRIYIMPASKKQLVDKTVEHLRSLQDSRFGAMQTRVDDAILELAESEAIPATEQDLVPGHNYGTIGFSLDANAWRNGKLIQNHGEVYLYAQTYQADGTFYAKNAWGAYIISRVKDHQLYIDL